MRRGFTVLELMIVLLISGMVVLTAERLFRQATVGLESIQRVRLALDNESNARRWLELAALSIEIGGPHSAPFDGAPESLRFTTRLETSRGWRARRTVSISRVGDSVVAYSEAGAVVLFPETSGLDVDYLLQRQTDATWVREYRSPVSVPLAIRLRRAHRRPSEGNGIVVDTLILIIPEHG